VEHNNNTCHLCLEDKIDPDREDNLCKDCGMIVDKYNLPEETLELEELDHDCGC